MNNKNIFESYKIVFIISIAIYILVLFDIQSLFKEIRIKHLCILNDSLFLLNVLLYLIFIIISVLGKPEKKPDFWRASVIIGSVVIFFRYFLNKFCSSAFSNIFGYSKVSFESNKIFYDIINETSKDSISEIYSNHGSLINLIDYKPLGYNTENDSNKEKASGLLNMIKRVFFDSYNSRNKSKYVVEYFEKIGKVIGEKEKIDSIVELLEKKYNIAKYIWSLLLIVILYSLSIRFVYL